MGKFHERLGQELSLYVRQQAWLWAVPRDKDKGAAPTTTERLSRAAELKRIKVDPQMPPCPLPHLIDRLHEIGPVETNGMERVPISEREIHYWQLNSGVRLPPWQAKLLRRLSKDFAAQLAKSEDPDCPPPWGERVTVDILVAVDRELEMMLSRMSRQAR